MSEYKGIMVHAELREKELAPVTLELLAGGRKVADQLGDELSAALLGHGVKNLAKELIAYGADKVYLVDHPLLADYTTDAYAKALYAVLSKHKPEAVLFGATPIGKDLAPRVAARLRTGLSSDCTELEVDVQNRLVVGVKPAIGGNVMARIVCPRHKPQMFTIRPKALKPLLRDDSRTGEVVEEEVELSPSDVRVRRISFVKEVVGEVRLEDAEVVVAAGRGVGKDYLKLVEELANLLGGAVGSTRPLVDDGLLPPTTQIGQTGKITRPKLYIGFGISGAVQHTVGMQDSEVIVAVNRDPEAPIFDLATLGIVGDVREILPALVSRIKEIKGS